ncbi:MAG TPA: DivIVA domain-containing protein [Jiangellaceae bacterium]
MAVSRDPAFRTVRMREAYDLDAVDDFVDRVIDALEGRPNGRTLTPEKIEAQEFKVVRMREGYSMDDVDDWLDDAAVELRAMRTAAGSNRRAPAAAPQPARREPTYEQVGAPTVAYAGPPAPAPAAPAAAPVPAPMPAPMPAPPGYSRPEPEPLYRHTVRSPLEPESRPVAQVPTPTTGLHHLEVWVRDLDVASRSFGWLFERLGWTLFQVWEQGRSWQAPGEGPYVVIERSPDLSWTPYDRTAPGLNHLALAVPERWMVDRIVSEAPTYGWRLMFTERHPYAGGTQHYAAYLENDEGFEAEVVAP